MGPITRERGRHNRRTVPSDGSVFSYVWRGRRKGEGPSLEENEWMVDTCVETPKGTRRGDKLQPSIYAYYVCGIRIIN